MFLTMLWKLLSEIRGRSGRFPRRRCGNPKLKLRAARAPDHARVFCLKARNWFDGGVASLGKAPGVSALGSLAELSPEEKRKLDKFEKPAYLWRRGDF